jgi:hypothetical protein
MAGELLFLFGFLAIPTAVGVAIFRYWLYDINILINRTLVYGTLTASLALVCAGSVALLQGVLRALTLRSRSSRSWYPCWRLLPCLIP